MNNNINVDIVSSERIVRAINAFLRKKYNMFSFCFESEEEFKKVIMPQIETAKNVFDGSEYSIALIKDKINYKVYSYVISKLYSENYNDKSISINDSIGTINQYLKEVYSKPLLSQSDLKKLLIESSKGNKKARSQVIESNLRMVVNNSMNYLEKGIDYLDIIQEGNIALQKAIDKFDVERIDKFNQYLKTYICGSIIDSMRKKSLDTIPLNEVSMIEHNGDIDLIEFNLYLDDFIKKCCLNSLETKIFLCSYGLYGECPLNHNQIAEKFGLTYYTATTIYNNAMKKIRKRYSEILKNKDEVEKRDFVNFDKDILNNIKLLFPRLGNKRIEYALNNLSIDELKIIKNLFKVEDGNSLVSNNLNSEKEISKLKLLSKIKKYAKEYNKSDKM